MSGALFLDRDGTIIADRHYLGDPALVSLLPGAARAIHAANAHAVPVFVVTNQSGIGRGLITLEQFHAVNQRMITMLAAENATITATYHCPHFPDRDGACECRKPGLGMYRQAAAEHGVSLAQSAFIGDRWRDVEPGVVSGGFAVMVPGRDTPADEIEKARMAVRVETSMERAASMALEYVMNGQLAQEQES